MDNQSNDQGSPSHPELTMESFVASLIFQARNPTTPHWLCTDEAIRESALQEVRQLYQQWVKTELHAESNRQVVEHSIDDLLAETKGQH